MLIYIKFLAASLKDNANEEEVKKYNDKKEEIVEFCSLFVRDNKKLLDENQNELDALKHTKDFDSRYLEEEINSKKIELLEEKRELIKANLEAYEGKDEKEALSIRVIKRI